MPQPLSRKEKGHSYWFPAGFSTAPPEVARAFASVLASWPYLELELGSSLAKLLGSHGETGVPVVAALKGNLAAQRKVVEAVAKAVLSGDELKVFCSLLYIFGQLGQQRNEIAHGLWGSSSDLPEALLLMKQGDSLARAVISSQLSATASVRASVAFSTDRSHISVYTAKDFHALQDEIYRLRDNFVLFWFMKKSRYQGKRERLFRELLEAPHVRKAMERLFPTG